MDITYFQFYTWVINSTQYRRLLWAHNIDVNINFVCHSIGLCGSCVYLCVQGVTQKCLEDDILEGLEKTKCISQHTMQGPNTAGVQDVQWCNLTLAWWFWVTKWHYHLSVLIASIQYLFIILEQVVNQSTFYWSGYITHEHVKKKTFSSQQTYLYIRVTDILKFY